ncbi:hypothetical protein [Urechidicola croceus]|uniref:Uncharacterized protein n=1 Tax=Urechidicola croceus TaxID=1850246 RepID=A0A1D8P8X0_9FLAO|nr:hypothetical protein [Urechidicola croceus]AOW21002.1 hypothetical protein LPB138_10070 [Urechidicola croceus]
MKNLLFLLCIIGLLCTTSCDSNDNSIEDINENIDSNDTSSEIEDPGFYALKVGNSWVYKNYKFKETSNSYEFSGVVDSISIVDTHEINNNTYFKFKRKTIGNDENDTFLYYENGESIYYLRDSIGYLINDSGNILYANNHFEERIVIEDNIYTAYAQLNRTNESISTEAGEFECLETEIYAVDTNTNEQFTFRDYKYYSDGIGLVYETCSFFSLDYPIVIRRLDSYSITE